MRWLSWIAIPSWLISLAVHVSLFVAAAFTIYRPTGLGSPNGSNDIDGIFAEQWGGAAGLPGDGTGQPIGAGSGIHLGPAVDEGALDKISGRSDAAKTTADAAAAARQPGASSDDADDSPPVELELPSAPQIARTESGTGLGSAYAAMSGDARDMIKPTGRGRAGGAGGPAGEGGAKRR